MFTRLLVANRGEIACRIMKTARRLGVHSIAVYTDPDRGQRHVAEADEAWSIGERDGYLDIDRLIAAARDSGAEALHPGYGFLSENPALAEACEGAGIVFVGPPARASRIMGLKDSARAVMVAAGVPVSEGHAEESPDDTGILDHALDIGFPVIIKAVAGGGGRGLRRVEREEDFPEALRSARRETEAAFGDRRMLVERFMASSRHVEVQVLADSHGTVLHLPERDCSVQRRWQKLIEESPAPGLPARLRQAMGEAAVAAARAVDYRGAGTVEFIVADGSFSFLEMNTRLQVEHPVTEAITGLDLVELQLRAATGEPLGLGQSDVTFTGHSIEARINAEDPYDGFSPRAGQVRHLSVPDGVRWDASVAEGSEVTPYYDPLIAKLIVTRPDRASALDALRDALDGLIVGSVSTNAGFLSWLTDMPALRSGDMTTNVIDALGPAEMGEPPSSDDAAPAAAAAWMARLRRQRATQSASPWSALGSFRLTEHRAEAAVLLRDSAGDLCEVSAGALSGTETLATASSADASSVAVNIAGHTVTFEVPDRADAWAPTATDDTGSVDAVAAPFPAVVVEVPVVIGDVVAAGDVVVVVEAMKMLHSLAAHGAGTVAEIRCSAGDAVEADQVLVTFERT